jgi:hypothetical protein
MDKEKILDGNGTSFYSMGLVPTILCHPQASNEVTS